MTDHLLFLVFHPLWSLRYRAYLLIGSGGWLLVRCAKAIHARGIGLVDHALGQQRALVDDLRNRQ